MNQYLTFLISHWELSILFIVAFIWVVLTEINSRRTESLGVESQDAIELINKKSAKIFDLRKEEVFVQGHIVGAKQVNFDPNKDDPKTVLKISPQTTCLFVCNIGQTSHKVTQALRVKGYLQTFSLNGGMIGWQKENLPTLKGK
jgi:rhodanese-related sulfurtransferase